MLQPYASRTDGIDHRTGRRVRVFVRAGRKFLHIELGALAAGLYRRAA